jgi:hypothetical protein
MLKSIKAAATLRPPTSPITYFPASFQNYVHRLSFDRNQRWQRANTVGTKNLNAFSYELLLPSIHASFLHYFYPKALKMTLSLETSLA